VPVNLPHFSTVKIPLIEKQLSEILSENLAEIKRLLASKTEYDWDNLFQPLEDLDDRLNHFWAPISHMHAVISSEPLREAYKKCLPMLSDYSTALGHDQALFSAIKHIASSPKYNHLTKAQQKIIDNELISFKLAGIDLPKDEKAVHAKLCKELSELTNKFEEHVLDATQAWHYHVTDSAMLSGLPEQAISAARDLAKEKEKSGWLFSLEAPSYLAVMMHADSREFRKAMYHAYVTRASDQGPNAGKFDNSPVMIEILKKRLELARLLGFVNFAELSLARKMVKKPAQVLDFLHDLVKSSADFAKKEFAELQDFAKKEGAKEVLAWDVAYYSEKLCEHRYAISEEVLKPYFPEAHVINGLFTIAQKLFSIRIEKIPSFDAWHKDAQCFAIHDDMGNIISYLYMDLYARENKRGGAWMDELQTRRKLKNGKIQIPIALLTCNFSKPTDGKPALFSHDEVVTLFHEFGHSLQHMLTKVDYSGVSGIHGIPWDAVEIASQFLENWAWEKTGIDLIAAHYETNEPISDELFSKMHRAKNFQSAMQMVRQLEFALFDFRLHLEFDPKKLNQVEQILNEIRQEIAVIPVAPFNRFQHGFSHIFAGGYAAGYYSYKWAEVMAADAFSLFLENGVFDKGTSQKFQRTFLESGGAVEPMELFIEFRGREPQVDALLKQSGIKEIRA
jgi:oligopeptidase A